MPTTNTRRRFLADVGCGTLIAAVGSSMATDLGLASAAAAQGPEPARLTFGELEGLVALMQDTPADRIVPVVIDELRRGTEPRRLVAAAALANARTFGGEDYVGFHTMMALAPAFHMSRELPEARQSLADPQGALSQCQPDRRRPAAVAMRCFIRLRPGSLSSGQPGGEALREQVRGKDMASAEQTFAALATARASMKRSTTSSSPSRTTPRSIAPCSRTAPGTCSRSSGRSTPTRCCGNRSTTVSRASATGSTRPNPTRPGCSCPGCLTVITSPENRWAPVRPRTDGSTI